MPGGTFLCPSSYRAGSVEWRRGVRGARGSEFGQCPRKLAASLGGAPGGGEARGPPVRARFADTGDLPEVTDASVWTLTEQERYLDPDGRRVLRLINGPTAVLTVNREYVDPSSIRSIQDLLKPEFKGKIAGEDPTVPGSGGNTGAALYVQLGEDFVRKLYVEQLTSTRDPRQFADWVARGQYPIGLGVNAAQIDTLLQDGFPVEVIRTLPDVKSTATGAYGVLYVVEGAQHPNAARLFANWIASREGLEIFSRAERYPATRKDINYAEWVPEYGLPQPGVSYLDTYNWEFKTRVQPETMAKIRDLLAAR